VYLKLCEASYSDAIQLSQIEQLIARVEELEAKTEQKE
jgi:hypothetical protein